MKRLMLLVVFVFVMGGLQLASAEDLFGPGNPTPGAAHDTIIVHLKDAKSGPMGCNFPGQDGGHAVFVRFEDIGGVAFVYETDIPHHD